MNEEVELLNSRILIVDDEYSNVLLLERILGENGFTSIQSSTDPIKGLEIFKEGNIDLVLLDLRMPKMSGYQFMENIRETSHSLPLPVLILTADLDPEIFSRSFDSGAADFLTKPFRDTEVVNRIINLLRIFYYRKKIEDINEILEKKVEARTADLIKVNKELENFIFSASHDLQEPMRKIITFGDLLQIKLADSKKEESRIIEKIQKFAFRMKSMVDKLLEFSRISILANKFERIDLNEIAEESLVDLDDIIKSTNGTIQSSGLPEIEGDRTQILQLFQYLISNGLKYKKPNVAPIVKIESFSTKKNWHKIIFEDNGIGFENKYNNIIFEPFKRLHSQGEIPGTGLGLFLCEKIVAMHNGTITANGKLGEGSKLIVELPGSHSKEI